MRNCGLWFRISVYLPTGRDAGPTILVPMRLGLMLPVTIERTMAGLASRHLPREQHSPQSQKTVAYFFRLYVIMSISASLPFCPGIESVNTIVSGSTILVTDFYLERPAGLGPSPTSVQVLVALS